MSVNKQMDISTSELDPCACNFFCQMLNDDQRIIDYMYGLLALRQSVHGPQCEENCKRESCQKK